MIFGTSLDVSYILKVQRILISSRIIPNSNSSQEQIRKMSQLLVLWQESNLHFCDAGAMLLPLSYRGSRKEQAWLVCIFKDGNAWE